MVYFIQRESGPVKIGTSTNVMKRLTALQSASPEPLHIRAACPGGSAVERAIHGLFSADRIAGEWFITSPALVALMDALRDYPALGLCLAKLPTITKPAPVVTITRPKRKRKISEETRAIWRENAQRLHAEGRLGGSAYGKLGGRPKKTVAGT
jgi:hypothetical protein